MSLNPLKSGRPSGEYTPKTAELKGSGGGKPRISPFLRFRDQETVPPPREKRGNCSEYLRCVRTVDVHEPGRGISMGWTSLDQKIAGARAKPPKRGIAKRFKVWPAGDPFCPGSVRPTGNGSGSNRE